MSVIRTLSGKHFMRTKVHAKFRFLISFSWIFGTKLFKIVTNPNSSREATLKSQPLLI